MSHAQGNSEHRWRNRASFAEGNFERIWDNSVPHAEGNFQQVWNTRPTGQFGRCWTDTSKHFQDYLWKRSYSLTNVDVLDPADVEGSFRQTCHSTGFCWLKSQGFTKDISRWFWKRRYSIVSGHLETIEETDLDAEIDGTNFRVQVTPKGALTRC